MTDETERQYKQEMAKLEARIESIMRGPLSYDDTITLDDYGIGHLTIEEAATIIVISEWSEGTLEVSDEIHDQIERADGLIGDPVVTFALKDCIEEYKLKVKNAINNGWLPAETKRDLDGQLITERTLINISDLEEWVQNAGGHLCDHYYEWRQDIFDVMSFMADLAFSTRGLEAAKNLKAAKESNDPDYVSLLAENYRLKKQLETVHNKKAERPVSTSQRRTLLTIIAALCDYSGIDPQKRGASQQIANLTEEIGAGITAETIKRYLDEIPDAIESRMK